MDKKIRAGIVGYGNVGRSAEKTLKNNPDFELVAIFNRPEYLEGSGGVIDVRDLPNYVGKIDLLLMCGSSISDLPEQVPQAVSLFNTVDSFDIHARIPEYFARADAEARKSDKLAMISTGWDPGLFSLMRGIMEAVVPVGKTYTFWGRGVSQGHSTAIRRIPGVAEARQYTVPLEATLTEVRGGENKDYTARQMHLRDCYVVAESGADLKEIEGQIKTMPDYFAPYDTTVNFIDRESFIREHSTMPHGGFVIRSGITDGANKQLMEFNVKLESNPEFTSSIMICFARAAWRLYQEGRRGAVTPFDVPIGYLSVEGPELLRQAKL